MANGHPWQPFWYALSTVQRRELERIGHIVEFAPEATLVRERDMTDFAIVLLDGCVRVSTDAPQGYQAILALRDAGDLVGELAGLDGGGRSATISALTGVQALILPAKPFRTFLEQYPEATAIMHRTVSGRLREATRRYRSAGSETVSQRLAALLLDLARRYGTRSADGTLVIDLPLTQADLAGLVLTTQRTLGRVLKEWREQGLVETGRRSVLLLQPAALQRLRQIS